MKELVCKGEKEGKAGREGERWVGGELGCMGRAGFGWEGEDSGVGEYRIAKEGREDSAKEK